MMAPSSNDFPRSRRLNGQVEKEAAASALFWAMVWARAYPRIIGAAAPEKLAVL